MSDIQDGRKPDGQIDLAVWEDLTELVNQLPPKERRRYRRNLAKFMHDLRHTLGLITNAEGLLRRDLSVRKDALDALTLLDIIRTAGRRAVAHLNAMVTSFGDQIEIDELEDLDRRS